MGDISLGGLHEHLDDALQEKMIFVHLGMVSKAGLVAPQIQKRARFIVDRLIDSKLVDLIFVPYNPRSVVNNYLFLIS